jgi:tRNA (guanine9-N1)-methyltransferase
MADAEEERPSKIRRLDRTGGGGGGSSSSDEVHDARDVADSTTPPPTDGVPAPRDDAPPPLSKSQLKKIRKQQEWEAGRELRKARRRAKDREKKAARRSGEREAAAAAGGVTAAAVVVPAPAPPQPQPQPQRRRAQAELAPVALVLDCGFDELMTDREVVSLGSQLTRCYSSNRAASRRARLVVSSFGGRLKHRFETVLANNHLGWKGVAFTADDFVAAATAAAAATHAAEEGDKDAEPAGQDDALGPAGRPPAVVYLTADSPHTLSALAPHTSYVVGGLVDKNRHKGACYKRACAAGVATARLPIGEYLTLQGRAVLATNHVVEIMVRWLEVGDWARAFQEVIPKRKDARLKTAADGPCRDDGLANDDGDAADVGAGDEEDGGDEGDEGGEGVEGIEGVEGDEKDEGDTASPAQP